MEVTNILLLKKLILTAVNKNFARILIVRKSHAQIESNSDMCVIKL
jgi:hypothetical protein